MACTNCGREMCDCPPWVNRNLPQAEPFRILSEEESARLRDYRVVEKRKGYKKERNGLGQVRITERTPGGGIGVTEFWE